jgi:hypothetical protein
MIDIVELRRDHAEVVSRLRAEVERLRNELRIRAEWFQKSGHPGMAEATRTAIEKKD